MDEDAKEDQNAVAHMHFLNGEKKWLHNESFSWLPESH